MKLARRAAKRDTAETAIIAALRGVGCEVWTELPCDLLVRVSGYRPFGDQWCLMEIKTPTKTGKRRKRKDQPAQDAFLAANRVPVVLTPEEALRALGLIS